MVGSVVIMVRNEWDRPSWWSMTSGRSLQPEVAHSNGRSGADSNRSSEPEPTHPDRPDPTSTGIAQGFPVPIVPKRSPDQQGRGP